jgi:formate hydrogenlyase transcriptional activator
MAWTTDPNGSRDFANHRWQEFTGMSVSEMAGDGWKKMIHPEDLARHTEKCHHSLTTGAPFENEVRVRRASDGQYRWFLHRGVAMRDDAGNILKWFGTGADIEDLKRAEAKLRQDEQELRRITDAIPLSIVVLNPNGRAIYANRVALDYTGLTLDDVVGNNFRERVFHPEDIQRLRKCRQESLAAAVSFENEQRALAKDGKYRWFLVRYNPLLDEDGKIVRWYASATDIDDRKRSEDRTRNENIALRDEVDKAFMFEEIVGDSPSIQFVLAQVAKVAPSDSTVLITGETGTGKELIARAIHKRSQRSARAFVNVNCASIPTSLIASELFGHEKGAFTGALQRRLGRFELAEGGTIFLDEVGELPMETQIALLRVLQEREFERIGSSHIIRADVRVIAATNRDLQLAIASGAFRSDLFYRLNVIPMEIPSLRQRKEDIPMLIEYFIDRYSRKAGKRIKAIEKKTLELLQAYSWPGNVRELQNIIERSVVLSETETFSVDESWLSRQPSHISSTTSQLSERIVAQEKEMIEAALAESKGRVSGPSGAAAKLGIPQSTLDSKIRSLKINKQNFKAEPI